VSKAEAAVLAAPSIAAPFATGIHHIGAVSIILAEGRCALTTSVTMFKYMFLYGIIQFVSVLILYALVLELTAEQ
jgi:cation-transporting ATPase 13A3/4/5